MSALLRLYPRAWRERYGDELAALLEERPLSLLDELDLIRGALDARLHPQVPGSDVAPEPEIPMERKLFGFLAAIGGFAWLAGVATLFIVERDSGGHRDFSVAVLGFAAGMALMGIALGGLGTRPGSSMSTQSGQIIGAMSIVLALARPWPLFILAFIGFPALTIAASIRATNNGRLPTWIVLTFVLGAAGMGAGLSGGIETDVGLALFALPGVAGLLLGAAAFTYHGTQAQEASPA